MKSPLENLEFKLLQTRRENAEKLDKIESEFKNKYSDIFDIVLKNDNLGFRRFISVYFQLEKLNHPEKSDLDILDNSINNALSILPLNDKSKFKLKKNLILFLKNNIDKVFLRNNDLRKDKNYPILQDLNKHGILNDNDLIKIGLKFKETNNFLESISFLSNDKKNIIKQNYFELNNTKTENRIESFKNDFHLEIKNSKLLQIYPKVLKFIGKNYFKLRLINKVESKKDRLRRLYKIAFLKLYRLKYSGIDIEKLIKKIDSVNDFDDFINLIIKYFEVLKQNSNLKKDYIVSENLDDVDDILSEAENNKEKILFVEKNIIKVNEVFEDTDKTLTNNELEQLLGDDVDLIGNDFKKRVSINSGILFEDNTNFLDDQDDEYNKKEDLINLEEYYKKLKDEYKQIEIKKQKLFLDANYDGLDDLNDELLKLYLKIEKVRKLLNLEDNNNT